MTELTTAAGPDVMTDEQIINMLTEFVARKECELVEMWRHRELVCCGWNSDTNGFRFELGGDETRNSETSPHQPIRSPPRLRCLPICRPSFAPPWGTIPPIRQPKATQALRRTPLVCISTGGPPVRSSTRSNTVIAAFTHAAKNLQLEARYE
jgi:hypothetical protein